jgi:hypothetical protein
MEENGIFTALLSVNVGVLALISTYLFAVHFFYNYKKNNTEIKLIKNINTIINTKRQLDRYRRKSKIKSEEIRETINKTFDLIESDYDQEKMVNQIFKVNSDIYFYLIYQDYISDTFLLKKDPKELQESITKIEEIEFFTKTTSNSLIFNKSIENIKDHKNNVIIEIKHYNSLEIEKAIERKHDFEKTINLVYEYHSLTQHKQETHPKIMFYILITISIIFGIVFPLLSISLFPYNTYIEGFKYDLSKSIGFFLTALSFFPYLIILTCYKSLFTNRHTSDTPNTQEQPK